MRFYGTAKGIEPDGQATRVSVNVHDINTFFHADDESDICVTWWNEVDGEDCQTIIRKGDLTLAER